MPKCETVRREKPFFKIPLKNEENKLESVENNRKRVLISAKKKCQTYIILFFILIYFQDNFIFDIFEHWPETLPSNHLFYVILVSVVYVLLELL